jgi:Subtilase family
MLAGAGPWSGRPFGWNYPDGRDWTARQAERRRMRRHLVNLATRADDREIRLTTALLRHRRIHRTGTLDFRPVRNEYGSETLAVTGEVLVRKQTSGFSAARGQLLDLGFTEANVDCAALTDRLARFTRPGSRPDDLYGLVKALRAGKSPEELSVSVSHVTPLAAETAVVKGIGGPELSAGRRAFVAGEVAEPVHVAVIDTGITAQRREDGWLEDVARDDTNIDVLDQFEDAEGDGYLDLAAGHGTFTAGVVAQVCPEARIVAYKAVDSEGIGAELDVACAMLEAAQAGADIINLSLGAQTVDDAPPVALALAVEGIADIERAQQRDILVVAAAGNGGDGRPCWPAAFPEVVAVGGVTADLEPALWSSRGSWVDCATVAEGVVAPYVEGKESCYSDPYDPDEFPANAWALWSGTSFSAPQVSGAVARRCHETGVTPTQAFEELVSHGIATPGLGQAVRLLPGT